MELVSSGWVTLGQWCWKDMCGLHSAIRGFPAGSVAKNPPVKQEAWVQSLGLEDPLEKEMATHSSVLAWRSSWTEEPGRPQRMGLQSWTRLGTHARALCHRGSRLCTLGTSPYVVSSCTWRTCGLGEPICAQLFQCGRCAGGCWSHTPRGYSPGLLAVGCPGFRWLAPTSWGSVIFCVFHEAETVRKHWFKWLLSPFLPLMISDSQIPSLAHCSTLSIYVNMWAENRNALKYQYK